MNIFFKADNKRCERRSTHTKKSVFLLLSFLKRSLDSFCVLVCARKPTVSSSSTHFFFSPEKASQVYCVEP